MPKHLSKVCFSARSAKLLARIQWNSAFAARAEVLPTLPEWQRQQNPAAVQQ
jgi:hypothetical protein